MNKEIFVLIMLKHKLTMLDIGIDAITSGYGNPDRYDRLVKLFIEASVYLDALEVIGKVTVPPLEQSRQIAMAEARTIDKIADKWFEKGKLAKWGYITPQLFMDEKLGDFDSCGVCSNHVEP